ncbi:hypothetical protein LTR85_001265 [Meristemomyces frigidus]|nr:hypothetical protein LTR85_001265 [Meristemomyces frigidus]
MAQPQQPLGAGTGTARTPAPPQTGLAPGSPEAIEERRQAMEHAATSWQKLVLANDTKAAGIMERAGKAAFGEEEFKDAMVDAVENA